MSVRHHQIRDKLVAEWLFKTLPGSRAHAGDGGGRRIADKCVLESISIELSRCDGADFLDCRQFLQQQTMLFGQEIKIDFLCIFSCSLEKIRHLIFRAFT